MSDNNELEWIELKEKFSERSHKNEPNSGTKLWTKVRENPLVPIGVCATTFCLIYGLINMKRGDHRKQQLAMRGRVMAQGFTVLALVSGIVFGSSLANRVK